MKATKTSMARLADWLSHYVDRPVVDRTGLEGVFDLGLKFSRESARSDADNTVRYPVVPLAIQEQLGLRLEKQTAPVDMLVVDKAERVPVEN